MNQNSTNLNKKDISTRKEARFLTFSDQLRIPKIPEELNSSKTKGNHRRSQSEVFIDDLELEEGSVIRRLSHIKPIRPKFKSFTECDSVPESQPKEMVHPCSYKKIELPLRPRVSMPSETDGNSRSFISVTFMKKSTRNVNRRVEFVEIDDAELPKYMNYFEKATVGGEKLG